MTRRLLVLLFVALAATMLHADWIEAQKLLASDGEDEDMFGCSCTISGEYAIVGAFFDDDNGLNSGSAYVYHWNGSSWMQQAKLTASDGAEDDSFGWSVAISGNYAIVGADGDDDNGSYSGSAYVFHQDGDAWFQQAKLIASDGDEHDAFGNHVAICGDYAAVGAVADDEYGPYSGSVYIFHRIGDNWEQQAKLTAADGEEYDTFGRSIAISGDYTLVGSPEDDEMGENAGAVYAFHREGDVWIQQAKLTAADGTGGQGFGCSVASKSNCTIIGACGDDDNGAGSGSAYIFCQDGDTWCQQAKLIASDGAEGDQFGRFVDVCEDYVVVGAFLCEVNNVQSGSAYVFNRINETWTQQNKLTASDHNEGMQFGWSVAIDGNCILVGANNDDDNGHWSGAAYIFEYTTATEPDPEPAPEFALSCCPNPTRGETSIRYSLYGTHNAGELAIFNVRGQLVHSQRVTGEGNLNWNGRDTRDRPVSSGVYLCRLRASDGATHTAKLMVVR